MDFVALDFETANRKRASICSVGWVGFSRGGVVDTWYSLVNPDDAFEADNSVLHGIREDHVRNAPNFRQLFPEIRSRIEGRFVVAHSAFDEQALTQACTLSSVESPSCKWIDTTKIAELAWPSLTERLGTSLAVLADYLSLEFQHHNALDDARTAGLVLYRAIQDTGRSVEDWAEMLGRSYRWRGSNDKLKGTKKRSAPPVANPHGPLAGQTALFTGFPTIDEKAKHEKLAAMAGCTVKKNFSRKITILVVGEGDPRQLGNMTGKHREALRAKAEGQSIEILSREAFLELVEKSPLS